MKSRRREQVYKRDGYKCLKCGTTDELTIDHIVPKYCGGSSGLVNLQTLCRDCNIEKGVSIKCYNSFRRSKNYANSFKGKMFNRLIQEDI